MRISTLSWLKLFVLYTMLAHSTENRKKSGLMDKPVLSKVRRIFVIVLAHMKSVPEWIICIRLRVWPKHAIISVAVVCHERHLGKPTAARGAASVSV